MNSDEGSAYFVIRLLGALGGFIGGAFAGILAFIVFIIVTGVTFGLPNIWPAAIAGSAIGALREFYFRALASINWASF